MIRYYLNKIAEYHRYGHAKILSNIKEHLQDYHYRYALNSIAKRKPDLSLNNDAEIEKTLSSVSFFNNCELNSITLGNLLTQTNEVLYILNCFYHNTNDPYNFDDALNLFNGFNKDKITSNCIVLNLSISYDISNAQRINDRFLNPNSNTSPFEYVHLMQVSHVSISIIINDIDYETTYASAGDLRVLQTGFKISDNVKELSTPVQCDNVIMNTVRRKLKDINIAKLDGLIKIVIDRTNALKEGDMMNLIANNDSQVTEEILSNKKPNENKKKYIYSSKNIKPFETFAYANVGDNQPNINLNVGDNQLNINLNVGEYKNEEVEGEVEGEEGVRTIDTAPTATLDDKVKSADVEKIVGDDADEIYEMIFIAE